MSLTALSRQTHGLQAAPGFKVWISTPNQIGTARQIRIAPNGDFFLSERSRIWTTQSISRRGKDRMPRANVRLRDRLEAAIRDCLLSVRREPSMGLRGQYEFGRPVPVSERRVESLWARRDSDSGASVWGGHWTRDVIFSKDGKSLLVAVGSASNVGDADTHPSEFHRANIFSAPTANCVRVAHPAFATHRAGSIPGRAKSGARQTARMPRATTLSPIT